MKSHFVSVGILLILSNLSYNCNANLFSPSSSPKRTELELEEVQPTSGLRGRARAHKKNTATTDFDEDTPHELSHHEYMEQHQLKHHRGRRGGGGAARRRKKNQNQKNGDKPKRQRPNKNKKGKKQVSVSCAYHMCISYASCAYLCSCIFSFSKSSHSRAERRTTNQAEGRDPTRRIQMARRRLIR